MPARTAGELATGRWCKSCVFLGQRADRGGGLRVELERAVTSSFRQMSVRRGLIDESRGLIG